MGYYTKYKLEIDPKISKREDVITFLKFFYEENNYYFPFSFTFSKSQIDKFLLGTAKMSLKEFGYGEETKWYDHEEEMKQLSSQLPGYIFTLKGFGEENEDIWTKYFKNGKIQKAFAKIELDEFDENKLE